MSRARPHRMLCMLSLVIFVQIVRSVPTNGTRALSCCAVYQAFDAFVASATGDKSVCNSENDCENSRLQFLVRRLNQLHKDFVTVTDSELIMHVDDNTVLANLLVSRVLAQYVSNAGDTDPENVHFQFEESTHTLKEVFASCVFQKELYTALLVVSVILLIMCLVTQLHVTEQQMKEKQAQTEQGKNEADSVAMPPKRGVNLRYRLS